MLLVVESGPSILAMTTVPSPAWRELPNSFRTQVQCTLYLCVRYRFSVALNNVSIYKKELSSS